MGKFVTVFEMRVDEPFRTFTDGCCGAIRTNEAGGDKYILEIGIGTNTRKSDRCLIIGDLFEENGYGSAGGRIYDKNGICPTITTRPEGLKTSILVVVK